MLKHYGLGDNYCKWVGLLYKNAIAEVLTNNMVSKPFNISRGCRQGSPLSPLLFLLAIEPFAITIRTNRDAEGITISGFEHKISLFADNVILFLKELDKSIPALLHVIEIFGKISGYQINNSQSSIMMWNEEEGENPSSNVNMFKTSRVFKYLGIKITPKVEDCCNKL